MNKYISKSINDLPKIAEKLILDFGTSNVILFFGEMGVGKTTLIKVLCEKLGVEEGTSSPTFSIVNEYLSKRDQSIYHFDFYRIEEETEVLDLGYEDYFYGDKYCFVEWPEKIPNLLPHNAVRVNIVQDEDDNRLISVVR